MFKKDENGVGNDTIIAQGVKVEGDFVSEGNVRIEGIVKGSVRTEGDLNVTETASIEAHVTATNATVAGEIRGNVTVLEKLELLETAKVFGDIAAKVLSVSAGATMEGRCEVSAQKVPASISMQEKVATA